MSEQNPKTNSVPNTVSPENSKTSPNQPQKDTKAAPDADAKKASAV